MNSGLVRIRRLCLAVSASLAAVALLAAPTTGQQGITTGSIGGVVEDPDGAPRGDVLVRVIDLERGAERQVLTDAQGRYRVALLPSGRYSVRAEFPPLQPVEVSPVRVSIGERTTVNLALQPIEAEELRVTVGAGVTDIDVTQGGVVELVDEEQISELPTAGRDFTDFIALSGLVTPISVGVFRQETGTGGQFSILGQRASMTNVTIDGADANNTFFGENRGGSRLPFTFSLESIKEFQIITNGYDVEYGRFSGGQINAVTKGGTNELGGEAWFFARDEALTANNFDGTTPADFQSFQFGGRLSGPIVRDKLHFFVSGDFQERDQPVFALDPLRAGLSADALQDLQATLRDVYGFDPATVDDMFGQFTGTDDQLNIFGRVDWTASPNHRLSVRVNVSDFESLNDEISPGGRDGRFVGSVFRDQTASIVAELNSILSPNVFNTFRFQWSNEDRPRFPNSNLPWFLVDGIPTEDGTATASVNLFGNVAGISFRNRLEEEKFQFTDNLSFQLGNHTLKVGTDNIFTSIFNRFWLFGNGFFIFRNPEEFADMAPIVFLRASQDLENPRPPEASVDVANLSAYIQDEWRVSDKLRLLGGLRWDFQNFLDEGVPLRNPEFQAAVEALGFSPTAVPSDGDNIAPRVSFTYDPRGDGSQLIRGGVGLFYGLVPLVTTTNHLFTTPDPLLFLFCLAGAIPPVDDVAQWDENPEQIPSQCEFEGFRFDPEFKPIPIGIGDVGAPEIAVWDPDMNNTRTVRANFGYERRLGDRWKVGAEGLYSRSWDLFGAIVANLDTDVDDGTGFRTADGRPVFISKDDFDPLETDPVDVSVDPSLRRLQVQTDNGDARAWSLMLNLDGTPVSNLRLSANYVYTRSFDNNSTECCTANALIFDEPTAGNPNFLGEPGDRDVGAWGPSENEVRHAFVLNSVWRLPAGFQVSGIYRAQSGIPLTPRVFGDLNADGDEDNDRPFLPDPATAAPGDPLNLDGLQFARQQDLSNYLQLLDDFACLREAVGTIVHRNTCRDPSFHKVDLKLKKRFGPPDGRHFEVIADLFNVLDAFGLSAGEITFLRQQIFSVVDPDAPETEDFANFDAEENEVVVTTRDFGTEVPAGFQPFQFQAQLGVRVVF